MYRKYIFRSEQSRQAHNYSTQVTTNDKYGLLEVENRFFAPEKGGGPQGRLTTVQGTVLQPQQAFATDNSKRLIAASKAKGQGKGKANTRIKNGRGTRPKLFSKIRF